MTSKMPVWIVVLTMVVALLPAGFASASDSTITIAALYRQDVPVTRDTSSCMRKSKRRFLARTGITRLCHCS